MSITKNVPLNWYSSMKKKLRKIRIIFDIEIDFESQKSGLFNCHLPNVCWSAKVIFYRKVLFFTQLSCHLMPKLLKKSWMVSTIQELLKCSCILHTSCFYLQTRSNIWAHRKLLGMPNFHHQSFRKTILERPYALCNYIYENFFSLNHLSFIKYWVVMVWFFLL